MAEGKIEMLRHTVATLAYRGAKALSGAPADFAGYRVSGGTRTPGEILAHIGDLLDWAVALAEGRHEWHDSPPVTWEQGTARFFAGLEALDHRLANAAAPDFPAEALFQGPVADALTHVGQISMLRRMAGSPVKGENYYRAHISAGRVGAQQAAATVEFD